ncbi:hypothetical protein NK6_3563 [Bradyrhizobium diazoefficiens]|uniref:Uncharacterized protein n=1 Tax=Bradyrhizobium diazoefficiens TaxID=1355477 RepID=A0A0E4BNK1_9BRAD|nr:hypothetical protein NK6_3563 [Bradyrhizobium diazoefficiens]
MELGRWIKAAILIREQNHVQSPPIKAAISVDLR